MKSASRETGSHWLSPSDALNRFQPPAGMSIGGRSTETIQRRRFGYRLGQLHLLIHPDARSEVLTQSTTYPVPQVPSWFAGVMNLRGNLLPIFDLHTFLEAGEGEHNKQSVLVLDQGRDMVGIVIDGLPQSVAPDRALLSIPPLHTALQEYVPAAYNVDEVIWLELEHQNFFTSLGRQISY